MEESNEGGVQRADASEVQRTVRWLPGWYASKLHAVPASVPIREGGGRMNPIEALCGEYVYEDARTEWAQRRVDRGVQHCKRCEKKLQAA